MDIVTNILILFIIINTSIKISFLKTLKILGISLLLGVFILWIYPYATEQSQPQIESFLQNSKILGDIAALVTLESIIHTYFCIVAFSKLYREKYSKSLKILNHYFGVLIFPAISYLLIQSIFYFTGVDFFIIAIILALSVFIGIPIVSHIIKNLIPEKDLRLEIHLFLSLLIAILGLASTINGNIIYSSQNNNIDISLLIKTLSGFLCVFGIGFLLNKLWWKYFVK